MLMLASKADERYAGLLREPDGKSGWSRHSAHQRHAYCSGLLNHLVAGTARDEEPATRKVFVRPDKRADHLVQRVVPADILSHDTNAFARYDPSGGVHAAGLTIDVLMVVNCAQGIVQLARAEGQAARDTRWGTYRILEGCCTAQPTARARARVSFTAQQLGEAVSSDADAHLESTIVVPQSL